MFTKRGKDNFWRLRPETTAASTDIRAALRGARPGRAAYRPRSFEMLSESSSLRRAYGGDAYGGVVGDDLESNAMDRAEAMEWNPRYDDRADARLHDADKRPRMDRRVLSSVTGALATGAVLVLVAFVAFVAFVAGVDAGEGGLRHRWGGASFTSVASSSSEPTQLGNLDPIGIPDGEPRNIVVAFQVRGDFGWLQVVKFVEAAFPHATIKVKNPGNTFLELPLLPAQFRPKHGLVQAEENEPVDIVAEGPGMFLGPNGCQYPNGPWIFVSEEPAMFYQDYQCPHSQTMLARLDTASSKVHRIDIPQTKVGDTTFLWAPLASANNHYFHNILTNRYPTGEKPAERPYLAAFLSANCQPHRTTFFNVFRKVALEAGLDIEKDGIHALGPCNHNHVWEPMKFDYPPKSLTADKIYAKYRFVITMENSEEIGYLTEKLSNSLAGGGVPVYFGDSKAAMRVFDYRSYVDMKRILVEANRQPNIEYITESDWEMVSRFILDLDKDKERYNSYLLDNVLASPEQESVANEQDRAALGKENAPTDYPAYFPRNDMSLEEQVERSLELKEATTRLRDRVFEHRNLRATQLGSMKRRAPHLGRDRNVKGDVEEESMAEVTADVKGPFVDAVAKALDFIAAGLGFFRDTGVSGTTAREVPDMR